MITNDDNALMLLNTLLRACKDAEEGFISAGDAVAEPELVQLFAEYGLQRAKFAEELAERIRTLRGTPEKTGTLGGEIHRAWTGLRAAIDSNETHAILAECERGEAMAVMAYAEALAVRDVDKITQALIQKQYEQVQAAHDRIRQLRDSTTYAHR